MGGGGRWEGVRRASLGGKSTAESMARGAGVSGLWSAAQRGAVAWDSAIEAQAASLFWDWDEAGHGRTSGSVGQEVGGRSLGRSRRRFRVVGRAVGSRRWQARYRISRQTRNAHRGQRDCKLAKSADDRKTMSKAPTDGREKRQRAQAIGELAHQPLCDQGQAGRGREGDGADEVCCCRALSSTRWAAARRKRTHVQVVVVGLRGEGKDGA
jgi:hypothetical protein